MTIAEKALKAYLEIEERIKAEEEVRKFIVRENNKTIVEKCINAIRGTVFNFSPDAYKENMIKVESRIPDDAPIEGVILSIRDLPHGINFICDIKPNGRGDFVAISIIVSCPSCGKRRYLENDGKLYEESNSQYTEYRFCHLDHRRVLEIVGEAVWWLNNHECKPGKEMTS